MTSQRSAFTLVEMLSVLAIIAVLMAFVAPALFSSFRSVRLTQATQMVLDQLSMARQIATSKNRVVEVRFYRLENPDTGLSGPTFSALQSFELQDDGTAAPLGKVNWLPGGVICDSGTTLSPLFAPGRAKQWTPDDTQVPIPRVETAYQAWRIRLRPDGTTDLPTGTSWFLTLHSGNHGDGRTTLPPDFSLVQIDPWTGQSLLYRP